MSQCAQREDGWFSGAAIGLTDKKEAENERRKEGRSKVHHQLFACGGWLHHLPPFPRRDKGKEKSERKMRGCSEL